MTKVLDKMIIDLNLRVYYDGYVERMETLITSNIRGGWAGFANVVHRMIFLFLIFRLFLGVCNCVQLPSKAFYFSNHKISSVYTICN